MKLNRFLFGFLLGLTPLIIQKAFMLADLERGFNATGGEVFTIALPLLIVQWRLWTVEQNRKKYIHKKITYKTPTP